jgi:hypothetical protein
VSVEDNSDEEPAPTHDEELELEAHIAGKKKAKSAASGPAWPSKPPFPKDDSVKSKRQVLHLQVSLTLGEGM